MDTLAERLNTSLARAGKTQQDLADELGITKSAVNHWCKGKSKGIAKMHLPTVARILSVDAVWLQTGEHTQTYASRKPL